MFGVLPWLQILHSTTGTVQKLETGSNYLYLGNDTGNQARDVIYYRLVRSDPTRLTLGFVARHNQPGSAHCTLDFAIGKVKSGYMVKISRAGYRDESTTREQQRQIAEMLAFHFY